MRVMTHIPWGPDDYIRALDLEPHPEGGHYRRTFTASDAAGARPVSTAIHYLLRAGQVSRLHRLPSDELWHFHAGDPLTVHMLHPDGRYETQLLGPELWAGMVFQAAVRRGTWFGAEPAAAGGHGFSLVGNTVAPGFDFADLELAEREALLAQFPRHRAVIERLT